MPVESKGKRRAPATPRVTPLPDFDWRSIAYHALVSRALDDTEESTNRNRGHVPKEHLVLYQFSARGHDVPQAILGSLLDHPRDGIGAYYRSRPILLSVGLTIEDALSSPLGRAGGFSDGRDIGVVCNLPGNGRPTVLPMSGDVGSQFTPTAGWAQAITYHRDTLGDASYAGAIAVALGGDASVATNGFWSSLTMATTLRLPMLFYIEDNDLGISVRGKMQTPNGNIARNLASFGNLSCGTATARSTRLSGAAPRMCAARPGRQRPALSTTHGAEALQPFRSRQSEGISHRREIARTGGGILPQLRVYLVPARLAETEWKDLRPRWLETLHAGSRSARPSCSGSADDPSSRIRRSRRSHGCNRGLPRELLDKLGGTTVASEGARCYALPTPSGARCGASCRRTRGYWCSAKTWRQRRRASRHGGSAESVWCGSRI
jgi:2-oxoisovalerate dehydrogenase E1 component